MQGDLAANFEGLLTGVAQLVAEIADEVAKPPAERSVDVIAPLKQRAERLKHETTMIVHSATQEKTRLLRVSEEAGLATTSPAELQRLQDIVNHGLNLHGRFDQVLRCFVHQMTRAPQPLYAAVHDPDDPNATLIQMLAQAFTTMDFIANPSTQDKTANELGCFSDIRLKSDEFAAHALAAYRVMLGLGYYNKARFLDVGCGGGGKVLMASQYFAQADGIEVDPGFAKAARQLLQRCQLTNSEIIEGNALEFDGYDAYEVVYFFQPMRDTDGLHALERKIVSSVRPGTVLIAPYLDFRSRADELGCRLLDGHLFVAGADEEINDRIRFAAEATGVRVKRDIVTNQWGEIWRPALQAFAANGFEV